jgi:hypothetical protein
VENRGHTKNAIRFAMILLPALWIVVAAGSSGAIPPAPSASSQLWERDIVDGLDPLQVGEAILEDEKRAGVTFLGNKELLIYAVYRKAQLSSRTSPELSSPFWLHVWRADSASGEIEAQREWGTRAHDSAVKPTSDGVLVKTGGIVKLYSWDFTNARDLPLHSDANARIEVSVSPSGRTIMIDRLPRRR